MAEVMGRAILRVYSSESAIGGPSASAKVEAERKGEKK